MDLLVQHLNKVQVDLAVVALVIQEQPQVEMVVITLEAVVEELVVDHQDHLLIQVDQVVQV